MGDPAGRNAGGQGDPRAPRNRTSSGRRVTTGSHGPAPSNEGAASIFSEPFAAQFHDLMEAFPVAAFIKDPDGRYVYANPYLLATMGKKMGSDWFGKTDADMWPPESAAMVRAHDDAVRQGAGSQIFSRVLPLEDGPHTILLVEFPMPTADNRVGVGGIGVDVTQQANTEDERNRLASGIEQAAESVVITDRQGRITYVNPAFERVTGYLRAEVMGKNPRLLKGGLQTPWFYEAMWASITNGLPWVGDLINRRKDGTLFTEETVISPIRDSAGSISSYVAVKRDVTHERSLEERSTRLARRRALIAGTISDLRPGDTPEATAEAICRQVVTLTGVAAAGLFLFEPDGRALPIGFVIAGQSEAPLRLVPPPRSRYLRERAEQGPWIEPWVSRPTHPYNQLLNRLGIHSVAYAPVRHHQKLIGLLLVSSVEAAEEVAVAEALPALVEFADLVGMLIGRDVAERTEAGRGRDQIAGIILRRAFGPVFQPIVDLLRDEIVGYEALTRFADGSDPELVFAQAAAVGLGTKLETATLAAALAAAEGLPQSAWLNLNATPELILAGEQLRILLAGTSRRIVLEVTEHAAITDYPAFRAAMAALGPTVEFAVDDAGTGFASLRHIVELRPAFVKLDRSLIAGLENDDARQAMIVGLCHFASVTGCRLIVEGIETQSELILLRGLAIELGQGYLLGRPLPVDETARPDRDRPELGD